MPASITSHPSNGEYQTVLPLSSDLPPVSYTVHVSTACLAEAGTDKNVSISLAGDLAQTPFVPLTDDPSHNGIDINNHSNDSQFSQLQQEQQQQLHHYYAAPTFPVASVCEFTYNELDVGNILNVSIRHEAESDEDATWRPEKIVVKHGFLHRTWTFICPRWLSVRFGNTITLQPVGDVAAGQRASRRASRRISNNSKSPRYHHHVFTPTPSTATDSRHHFETMRERFADVSSSSTDVVVSNGTEAGTKRLYFQLQKFSHMAAHMYITGSIPALGEWRPEHAVRMTQHCSHNREWRGEWRLELEIDDDYDEIGYRYMIVSEGETSDSRLAIFTDPMHHLKLSGPSLVDRHAEGGRINVKDTFRMGKDNHHLGASPFTSRRANSVINTPNGHARLLNPQLTPRRGPPMTFETQHTNMNGAVETSADPVSSESSLSNRKTTHPVAEECSAPLQHDDDDMNTNNHTASQWDHSVVENSATTPGLQQPSSSSYSTMGRNLRRQSDELSTDSTSSHVRSHDQRPSHDSYTNGHPGQNSDEYSPKSSEEAAEDEPSTRCIIPGEEDDDNVVVMPREEADRLREDCEVLEVERNRTVAELEALKHQMDDLQVELESTMRERDTSRAELEDVLSNQQEQQRPDDEQSIEISENQQELLRAKLSTVEAERDEAISQLEIVLKDREIALEELDAVKQQQSEKALPQLDALILERDEAKTREDEIRSDRDAILAERDALAQDKKLLSEELERTREAASANSDTFSKLSETNKNLLQELDELRSEVVDKQEEIDAQAQNLEALLSEKQAEFEAKVRQAESERNVIHERWLKEFRERRKLFNTVQELRGNIRVFCRVRPLKSAGKSKQGVSFPDPSLDDNGSLEMASKTFEFDRVFQPDSTQQEVYDETADVVQSVVDGYNVCVFAYGQTGSGKTHTMNGVENDRGVNYRALENLFEIAGRRKLHSNVTISVSMLEIYNENLRDLILPENMASSPPKLEIRRDATGSANAVHVPNLTEVEVTSFEHTWDVMQQGSLNRSKGRTDMNEHSSRSHLIVRVTVRCENIKSGTRSRGVLHMVDLAGSERVSRSNASGDRLKEAQHINKSLSSLGDVFAALVKNNSTHIPYRNSKLTYLLQDSLGGDSKTLMFVNISSDLSDESETLSSLQFAQRVAKVELGSAKKHAERGPDPRVLHEKEAQNTELVNKVQSLQRELRKRDECIMEMRVRARGLEGDLVTMKENMEELTLKESSNREGSERELRELKESKQRDSSLIKSMTERIAEMEQRKDEEIRRLHSIVRSREKEIAGMAVEKGAEENMRRLQAQLHARDREIAELKSSNNSVGAGGSPVRSTTVGLPSALKKQPSNISAHTSSQQVATPASIPGPFLDRPASTPVPHSKALLKEQAQSSTTGTRLQRTASSLPGRAPRQVRFDNSVENKESLKARKRSSLEDGPGIGSKSNNGESGNNNTNSNGVTNSKLPSTLPPAMPSSKSTGGRNSSKAGILAPPRRAKDMNGIANGTGIGGGISHHSSTNSSGPMRTMSATRMTTSRTASNTAKKLGSGASSAYSLSRMTDNSNNNNNNNGSSGNGINGNGTESKLGTSGKQGTGSTRTTRVPRSQTTMLRPPQRAVRQASAAELSAGRSGVTASSYRPSSSSGGLPSSSGPNMRMPRRAGTVTGLSRHGAQPKTHQSEK